MTDRADERRVDDSSDASSDSDPFEYPADAETRDESDRLADRSQRRRNGGAGADSPTGVLGWLRWFWTGDTGSLVYVRDVLTSLFIVVAIGLLLFAASGVWPPMVAIESGSMEPNMERGDLVFLLDTDRFVPDGAIVADGVSTGVVPADVAERNGRTEFNRPGDVIVFRPNGNTGDTPIIHRAMFWVSAGENWYDRADSARVADADNCEELNHCPAPHAGFITKGDNELTNQNYDQASRLSAPVRPDWIVGTAELRVPYLGHVRLWLSGVMVTPIEPAFADSAETPAARDDGENVTAAAPVRATPRPA